MLDRPHREIATGVRYLDPTREIRLLSHQMSQQLLGFFQVKSKPRTSLSKLASKIGSKTLKRYFYNMWFLKSNKSLFVSILKKYCFPKGAQTNRD